MTSLRTLAQFIIILTLASATLIADADRSVLAQQPNKIRIGTFPIPLMVVDSENGVFIDLTNEILKRAKLDAEIVVLPPKRTMLYFNTKDVDVVFPALDVFFATGIEYTKPSEIFYVKEDFVFTRKGDDLLRIIPELEDKYVGITRGYAYAPELLGNPFVKIELVNTDEQNAQKLIAGRVDAFVVEEFSGLKAFKDLGLEDKVQYDPTTPLSRQDVFFAFQGTDDGKALSDRFSEALRAMKNDGTFDQIMSQVKPSEDGTTVSN